MKWVGLQGQKEVVTSSLDEDSGDAGRYLLPTSRALAVLFSRPFFAAGTITRGDLCSFLSFMSSNLFSPRFSVLPIWRVPDRENLLPVLLLLSLFQLPPLLSFVAWVGPQSSHLRGRENSIIKVPRWTGCDDTAGQHHQTKQTLHPISSALLTFLASFFFFLFWFLVDRFQSQFFFSSPPLTHKFWTSFLFLLWRTARPRVR